jgi:hypothetical protein
LGTIASRNSNFPYTPIIIDTVVVTTVSSYRCSLFIDPRQAQIAANFVQLERA